MGRPSGKCNGLFTRRNDAELVKEQHEKNYKLKDELCSFKKPIRNIFTDHLIAANLLASQISSQC